MSDFEAFNWPPVMWISPNEKEGPRCEDGRTYTQCFWDMMEQKKREREQNERETKRKENEQNAQGSGLPETHDGQSSHLSTDPNGSQGTC